MQFSAYILLGIAAAACTHAVAIPEAGVSMAEEDLVARVLAGRALPSCKPCPKGRDLSSSEMEAPDIEPALLEAAKRSLTERDKIYPAGYVPDLCNTDKVNCMFLGYEVNYIRGGIAKHPLGHWSLDDGTQIYAWHYWQSTILFAGPGGSAITYPAHCTVYTCVKGAMLAHIFDDNINIVAGGLGTTSQNCQCSYNLNTDQFFGLIAS